jgi:hypothetical protein
MNEVHAGGVRGGIVLSRRPYEEVFIIFPRLGRSPLSIHGWRRSKVAPSKPITKTLEFIPPSLILPEVVPSSDAPGADITDQQMFSLKTFL